jgi:beta-lactamase superfamily II metal-dependent hydrolase
VDHGACALLTIPMQNGACRIMIDSGHSADYLGSPWHPGKHLAHLGVGHLDLLVCTNYDEDHASGFPSLVEHGITIGCILGNPTVPAEVIVGLKTVDGMGPGIRALASTMEARRLHGHIEAVPEIPGVELAWAWNPWPHWDTENNLSLVLHMRVFDTTFLFTGDMERDGFNNLLRNPVIARWMSGIHVLMAPHHGRENGRCTALFDVHGCSPQLVVISDCAKRHQSQETVPYYSSKATGVRGVRRPDDMRYVMTTRSDGEIRFHWEGRRSFVS